MRIQNVSDAIYRAAAHKKMSGEFGYGDYGSAVADVTIDTANQSWTDEQLQQAKADWREMVLNLQNAIKARNNVIASIKSMPDGDSKQLAIGNFRDADSIFMEGYELAQPLFQQFASVTGDSIPSADAANFGLLPLAAWVVVVASLAIVGAVSAAMYNSKVRYEAILQNPSIAQYDNSGPLTSLFSEAGSGLKWGIMAIAVVGGFILLRKTA